jgi:protein SCO1/2
LFAGTPERLLKVVVRALASRPSRRSLLVAAALSPLGALSLASCGRRGAAFHSIDVTGAGWGRDFRLRDPAGREGTLADFRGKVVLLFFGFTQCPDVCPTALSRAVEVLHVLGDDGGRVQVIFATVDPERDTPELLREYTQAFHPSFLGLRADAERTAEVANEFRVIYQKVPTASSYTMDHTALSFVFDPTGRLRLTVRHGDAARDVADDIRQLLPT